MSDGAPPRELGVSAILASYFANREVRFMLCQDDGTEICDLPAGWLVAVSDMCRRLGHGYIKQVDVRFERWAKAVASRAVWP